MRIIVVDGLGFTRHTLKQMLTSLGHAVSAFSSAEEGLEVLKRDNTVQIVITELMLPSMDAISFFRYSQAIDRYSDSGTIAPPAFVLVTTDNRAAVDGRKSQLLQKALDVGFATVLLKPVGRQQLEDAIATISADRAVGPFEGAADRVGTLSEDDEDDYSDGLWSIAQELVALRLALQDIQRDVLQLGSRIAARMRQA